MGDFDGLDGDYIDIFKTYMGGMPYWDGGGAFNPVVFKWNEDTDPYTDSDKTEDESEKEIWTPVEDLIDEVWNDIDNSVRYKWAGVFNMANTLCDLYDIRHCSIVSKWMSVGDRRCLSFVISRRPNGAPFVDVAITEDKGIIVKDPMYGTVVGNIGFSFNRIISIFDTIEKMICDDEDDNEVIIELETMCAKINDDDDD